MPGKGQLAKFSEGDYVLVAREDLFEDEKLCLRCRGPRQVVKELSDYVFRVEDLHNGNFNDVHGTRLKFYRERDLDKMATMPYFLSSETGRTFARAFAFS